MTPLNELAREIAANLSDIALLADGGDQEAVAEAHLMASHVLDRARALGANEQVIWRLDNLVQTLEGHDASDVHNPCPVDFTEMVLAVHGAFALQLGYLNA